MKKLYTLLLGFPLPVTRPFLILLLIFIACKGYSQPGVLDATFGNKGKVVTSIGGQSSGVSDEVLQGDGKIIVIATAKSGSTNSFALIRYTVNGALDGTFGSGGILLNTSAPFYSQYLSMALQDDEKIIVGGFSDGSDFMLSRYNNNGTIDSSFGINGVSRVDFNASSENVSEVFIKPGGKIVTIGKVDFPTYSAFGMAQFNQDGSVDSTFGTNGKVVVNVAAGLAKAPSSINMQSDGKVLMSGVVIDTLPLNLFHDGHVPAIIRINVNGTIDSSFGTNGIVIKRTYLASADAISTDIAVNKDGKILLLTDALEGRQIHFAVLHRLNADGTPDNSFGSGGNVLIYEQFNVRLGFRLISCNTVNVQPDNKILISGAHGSNFFFSRFNTNGTIDYTFGRYGFVTTDFSGFADISYTAKIQQDGKIILAGSASDGVKSNVALARYEQNALFLYNTLKGSVYFDANKNAVKDNGEKFFLNASVSIIKDGIDTVYKQALDGRFDAETDTGTYNTRVNLSLPYYTVVPSAFNTSHATYFNNDSISFALQPISGKKDLRISIIPLNSARPGFKLLYKILYYNPGTDTIPSGTIQLINSSKIIFNSALPSAASVIGDTLLWNFTNLNPMDTASIIVRLTVEAPPVVNSGDSVAATAIINPITDDLTQSDNIFHLVQRATNSFDPNDKSENHGGNLTMSQVQDGEYMEYIIRFQNTGTDTALNVFIKDTLSTNVDWSTIQMITASHDCQLTIQNDNQCTWEFEQINLADSTINEPLSHGYIVYRVKVKNTLAAGDDVKNTASIYFDYNFPVQTNTETTTVENIILPVRLTSFNARKQGKDNVAEWSTEDELNLESFIIERSNNAVTFTSVGKVRAGLSRYTFIDKSPDRIINYYRLKMLDKDGEFSYSSVKRVNNSGIVSINIYPNPTSKRLYIQIDSEKRAQVGIQVNDVTGKTVFVQKLTITQGQSTQVINIPGLRSGSYFLKITTTDQQQTILKFEKM